MCMHVCVCVGVCVCVCVCVVWFVCVYNDYWESCQERVQDKLKDIQTKQKMQSMTTSDVRSGTACNTVNLEKWSKIVKIYFEP